MTTTGSTSQALDAEYPRDAISVRTVARHMVLASYERSALPLDAYAEAIVKYASSHEEVARRRGIRKRLDMLRDAWGPVLKASLENWLTPAVLEAVIGKNKDHLDLSRNPAKNIWKELASCYKVPPRRSTPKKASDGDRYVEMVSDTGFDTFWQLVEQVLCACNEVLVWPDVIENSAGQKVVKHRYCAGDTAVVVTSEDDPTEIEAVMLIDEYRDLSGEQHCKYRLWTRDWHAEFERNEDGELERTGYVDPNVAPEDDDSAANPYDLLHFTLIRLYPWGDTIWDSTSGEDLVDLTLRGGEERAQYRYLQKMTGFKQLVASGDGIDKLPQQLLDPGAVVKIEGHNVNTTVVDWQVDLKARLECMMADELAAAAAHGINPERYKQSASYESGYKAQSSERALTEERRRMSMILAPAEASYKRAFCVVAKAHGLENPPDPEIKLEVQYAPLDYSTDPSQQVDVDTKEIGLCMESQVTIMQRKHPEWDEKQCKQEIEKRMTDVAWVANMKATRNVPNDPTVESRSAEANGQKGPAMRDGQIPAGSPTGSPTGDRERP